MIKRGIGERVYGVFNTIALLLVAATTLYPFWYIVVVSLSDPVKFAKRSSAIMLWPAGFTLEAYERVLKTPFIYFGYLNTIFYAATGTLLAVICTSMAAYVLSRKTLLVRRFVMLMILFTMYFSGGMIPTYLLMRGLHLINNRLALILPGAISAYNMLILIRAFEGVPDSLEESARMDGAGDWTILFKIMLPLIKPTLMVIMLYGIVGQWNSWFSAAIYLRDTEKMPLQIFLRNILIREEMGSINGIQDVEEVATSLKFAMIMVSTIPILCVYPFIQKHFVKGVLIGSVKE